MIERIRLAYRLSNRYFHSLFTGFKFTFVCFVDSFFFLKETETNIMSINNQDESDDDSMDECPLFSRTQRVTNNIMSVKNKRKRDVNDDDSMKEIMELFPMGVQHKDEVNGYYALHTACYHGKHSIAMKLIDLFPEAARHQDLSGLYPINLACRFHYMRDVVCKLIEVFPEAAHHKAPDGSVLLFAFRNKMSKAVITKLIAINPLAIQEPVSRKGEYPIHWAIWSNQPVEIIKILLDSDPIGVQRRLEGVYSHKKAPLHLACETNKVSLVQYLMQRSDRQMNIRDSNGKTPLHYACQNYHDEIVDILLLHPDVDVHATDHFNNTPLHTTLQYRQYLKKSVKITQKLLDHPYISINQKNKYNKTPLDYVKGCRDLLVKRNIRSEDIELRYILEMIRLLEDFYIKTRWQPYCYHMELILRDDL